MAATTDTDVLHSILAELRDLKASHVNLQERLDDLISSRAVSAGSIGRISQPAPIRPGETVSVNVAAFPLAFPPSSPPPVQPTHFSSSLPLPTIVHSRKNSSDSTAKQEYRDWARNTPTPSDGKDPSAAPDKAIYQSRAVLTTYPGQVGIAPIPLIWGAQTAEKRGPILASRQKTSLGLRNAIGAYGGAYSIYHALSVAIGALDPNQRPNFTNTEPTFQVRPNPSWFDPTKIVTLDPWGHLAQTAFKKEIDSGIDIRPSISITRAHLKIAELDEASRNGRLKIDGKIVIASSTATMASDVLASNHVQLDAHAQETLKNIASDPGVDVAVSKVAYENVWYLPGVAQRLGVSENSLRRCLFEDTGGMYPELLTRQDLKCFFPPIGGGTCYIFGKTDYLSDPTKKLAVRVHDACSGSDIFGSDVCTCRPYLLHGIEEAIKCAQGGGVGLIVYFQKEGRALGEVTKYLVYNARKRAGDEASQYFARTENIASGHAGVKDSRFQALMPDILLWLGVTKIDDLYSMSDMKYNALVNAGITVQNRHDIPDYLIPSDSAVEIQAKINAGYFSSKGTVTSEDLTKTVGRAWEELDH
ncbi:MAG: hypothetical protein CYPHOPRED_000198 [Cyphobasidiales sp. Tagirdzhanova-0007]|nr:MAG: hypothetical protein CYPHOPRED_000198 [Cyphobasidiales sp. Tagirdzhanova-0007]